MITRERAKQIAEASWGKGGTTEYKCNRTGAWYFSCAGHGGYVVDGRGFTIQERDNIEKYIQSEYQTYIYLFEEDCAWCVLEKFTDIRSQGWIDEERHTEAIEQCFKNYYAKEREG